jgi:cytochrome c
MGLVAELAGTIRLIFLNEKMDDMKMKHIAAWLVTLSMVVLYGCQPDAPAQQAESSPVNSAPQAASQVPAVAQPAAAGPAAVKQELDTGAVAVSASKERDLAQKSGCFTCHTIEKKLIGPAWRDVATKYHGQKDAESKLVAKVTKGGSGIWGTVPMPPNAPRVNENDIKTLVHYILNPDAEITR